MLLVAFPPVPLFTGDALLPHAAEFPARKIRSAWVQFRPGHWALGLQKLPLVRFNARAWVFSTNAPGSGLSQAFSFKSCLKIGNVPNSEGFFARQGDLTQQYFGIAWKINAVWRKKARRLGMLTFFKHGIASSR